MLEISLDAQLVHVSSVMHLVKIFENQIYLEKKEELVIERTKIVHM